MPRILRILNRFNLGGPTYNACYLTKYLSPEFETMLVAGVKDESEESSEFIAKSMGIEPRYISGMKREISFSKDISAYYELKKLIKSFKPDIIHTHAAKAGALGRMAAYNCNVPVIVHTFHGHVFHSYFGKFKSDVFVRTERYLAKKSSAIVAISELQKIELAQTYKICSADKVNVIPLGFELDRFKENTEQKRKSFREKYALADDEIAIGIIGRIVPVKNHKLFLSAYKSVVEKTAKKIRAFIIGDGELRYETEIFAKNLGLEFANNFQPIKNGSITFTSWIKEIDVALAGLDIVAMTSLNEGTPVSLIEAQASSKPIVSTNIGGVEDVVLKDKTALLSENENVEEFTQNLLKLVENEVLRAALSVNGRAFAEQKYHVKNLVENTRSLYQRLAK